MLSDTERHEIEAEFAHYPDRRSVCIEAMKIVQQHRGWVSDEALDDVAAFLELSRAELEGVATFYNMIFRKPVGQHVMGTDKLRSHLCQRLDIALGETTADSRFTLLPNVCLGACDHAPVMMVDNAHYQDLDVDKVDSILEHYRQAPSAPGAR
jgi:NADH-quinone oxidoreductase subunit E